MNISKKDFLEALMAQCCETANRIAESCKQLEQAKRALAEVTLALATNTESADGQEEK